MGLSPPVRWADVATKQDLLQEVQALRNELHADMERLARRVIMWTSTMMVALAALAFAAGRFV
jgi:broad-specificity NMP kinase